MSLSLVVDVSVAESVVAGDEPCYNLLRVIRETTEVQIMYSNAWRRQWESVASAPYLAGIPRRFKEHVMTWLLSMTRRSKDGFVGLVYDQTFLRNQCVAKISPADQNIVFNAWQTVELALHPDAAHIIIFKVDSPQGTLTPCEVFRKCIILFASQEIAKICWAAVV